MSLTSLWEALTTVAGEVEGIRRVYTRPQRVVNEFPSVMPVPGNGATLPTDGAATMRPRQHNVRLWLIVAPLDKNIGDAMATLGDLIDPVMDRLIASWAVSPRHPLMQAVRRIDQITYTSESALTVGDTSFYGAEIIVALQEDPRVHLPQA